MSFSKSEKSGGGSTSPVSGQTRSQVLALIRANANNFTFGNTLPASALSGALHYITENNATISAVDESGDPITQAFDGNLFQSNGTRWQRIYNFRSLIEALIGVYSLYSGEYAASTAYSANRIVTHNNDIYWVSTAVADSNTDAPDSNTSFVQLNGGGGTSSGITAQQFLAAMPDSLKIKQVILKEGLINPSNILSEYTARVLLIPNAFANATRIQALINGYPSAIIAYDKSLTFIDVLVELSDAQQTQLGQTFALTDVTETSIEIRFINDSAITVYNEFGVAPVVNIASGGLTTDQAKVLARVGGFDIRDFRGGVPSPFISDPDELALAQKTIGIGTDGKNYTYEHTSHSSPITTWISFDNANWDGEQTEDLPVAALETGDFFYLPNAGSSPNRGVWRVYDGTKLNSYDDVGTFLTNHRFLGNFPNQASAAIAISSYDSNTTYLAYFPTTVAGRSGREVQQLSSYTSGTVGTSRWVSSDEQLHSLIGHVEAEIRDEINRLTGDEGVVREINKNVASLLLARDGVPLITSASEKLITNLNGTSFGRTQSDAVDSPSFTDVNLLQNSEVGYENTYLSRFDRIRLIVSLLGASNVVLVSTEIDFSYAKWASLKALPRPEQNSYQDATIQDNRALAFAWHPDDFPPYTKPTGNGLNTKINNATNDWITAFRNGDRTIFIGRTSQTNPRLTIAVRGYQGNVLGVDAIGYLGSST